MDIRKMYQDKLVSASEAAKTVKSGDWVDYAWTTSTPVAVDAEIAKRLPELYNVNFRGGHPHVGPRDLQDRKPG